MDDHINRAEVMKPITAEYNKRHTGDGLKLAWIELAVNSVPSAQPEIIHCKDCKHFNDYFVECESP